jgi:hypothetical protein
MTPNLIEPMVKTPCDCPRCRILVALCIDGTRGFSAEETSRMVDGLIVNLATLMAFMDDDGVDLVIGGLLATRAQAMLDPRIAIQIQAPQGNA